MQGVCEQKLKNQEVGESECLDLLFQWTPDYLLPAPCSWDTLDHALAMLLPPFFPGCKDLPCMQRTSSCSPGNSGHPTISSPIPKGSRTPPHHPPPEVSPDTQSLSLCYVKTKGGSGNII